VAITAASAGLLPHVVTQLDHSGFELRPADQAPPTRRASRSDQPEADQRRRAAAVQSRVGSSQV
jgi:hypothetical protein